MLKGLDLFCGLGGWSNGLTLEGFEMIGVELYPEIAKLYEHKVIVADVKTLKGSDFKGFDLIVGSPPCRDFSYFALTFGKTWKKNPPNIKEGLKNVYAFLRIVENAKPTFWLMENVPPLVKYLGLDARCISYLGGKPFMRRAFWGNFPAFLIPSGKRLPMRNRPHQKGRKIYSSKEERSKIPLPVARALGRAVKHAIERLKEGDP